MTYSLTLNLVFTMVLNHEVLAPSLCYKITVNVTFKYMEPAKAAKCLVDQAAQGMARPLRVTTFPSASTYLLVT